MKLIAGAKLCVEKNSIYQGRIEILSFFRYTDIKEDIAEELENLRDEGKALENVNEIFTTSLIIEIFLQELPKRISTAEEKEILSLLLKVHELEIDKVSFCEDIIISNISLITTQTLQKVGMKSEGLLKEHEVRRRDLLILKYDKQRSLCDEIILRQQKLIEGRRKFP